MVSKLASVLTDQILKWGYADSRLRDAFKYNVENRLSAVITYLAIILLGTLCGFLLPAIVYVIFFTRLRRFTGGLHAPTANICLLLSIGLCPVAVGAARLLSSIDASVNPLLISIASIVISGIIVFSLAPVNHPNLDLNAGETAVYRRNARITWLAESVILIVMALTSVPLLICYTGAVTMVMVSISIILAKLLRQEVNNEET